MKTCPRCHETKALTEFHKGGTDSYCKPCRLEIGRQWRREHPERHAEIKRRNRIKYAEQVRASKRRRYHAKLEHNRELQRAWRAAHPDVVAKRNRVRTETGYMRWKRYGLTKDECDQLLEAQGFCCAICGCPLASSRATHLDHDHETGRVRGFLCLPCNVRLALWERSASGFAAYRAQPPAMLIGVDHLVPER